MLPGLKGEGMNRIWMIREGDKEPTERHSLACRMAGGRVKLSDSIIDCIQMAVFWKESGFFSDNNNVQKFGFPSTEKFTPHEIVDSILTMKKISKQLRGIVTRTRIVVATIDLLASEGFSAVNMARVADLAEISAGPRQYYFPTPINLFEAVIDHILEFQELHFSRIDDIKDFRENLVERFSSKYDGIGSPAQRAIVELKMACRGNIDLRNAISSKIKSYEERADASFITFFKSSGLPDIELLAIRQIIVAASCGLSMSGMFSDRPEVLSFIKNMLPELLAEYISNNSEHKLSS